MIPVFYAYAVVTSSHVRLYVAGSRFPVHERNQLPPVVEVIEYDSFMADIKSQAAELQGQIRRTCFKCRICTYMGTYCRFPSIDLSKLGSLTFFSHIHIQPWAACG